MLEDIVRLIPDGHPLGPAFLSHLGKVLSRRFGCLGDLTDIDSAILFIEDAVDLVTDDHPDKPFWLDYLWDLFSCRFEHLHDPMDVEKSILVIKEVLRLTPRPHKQDQLKKIGISLSRRLKYESDLAGMSPKMTTHESQPSDSHGLSDDDYPSDYCPLPPSQQVVAQDRFAPRGKQLLAGTPKSGKSAKFASIPIPQRSNKGRQM